MNNPIHTAKTNKNDTATAVILACVAVIGVNLLLWAIAEPREFLVCCAAFRDGFMEEFLEIIPFIR